LERLNLLGVGISPINMGQATAQIDRWIAARNPHYVCVTPAHSVMECQADPSLRHIFNSAGMVTPDGMSVVWLLRAHRYAHVTRVYGPDLVLTTCESGLQTGYRHFFYGGAPGVPEMLAERLVARFPGLLVAGVYSPPFHALTLDEDVAVIERINNAHPDIVWVGISTPKQERWMSEHVGKLSAPVLIGVGAAFDFLSGRKRQAPKWMRNAGLEWLFRFASEPRRLWRRYIQYPVFVASVLAQLSGLKDYPLDEPDGT
jgi:N-acetylglucosaminyldiphosphoundecaprenol N-acetyl-beta-D-mannosaminyltransferase